ncbi:MAG: L,D-transpeptidase family protein [Desulfobulbus sp.]|nr:L,D-transpeptidase family protein [Desulfobulbus sp.]
MSDHCRLHCSGFALPGILAFLSLFFVPHALAESDSLLPQSPPPAQLESQQPDMVNHEREQQQLQLQQQLEQLYFEVSGSIAREPVYASSYLLDLYRKNQFDLLWDNQDNIAQLMGAIVASAEEGLTPDDYHLKALTHYWNELRDHEGTMTRKVEYDILLSDAMVLLGQHKRYGKVDPAKVEEKQNLAATTPRPSPIDAYLGAIRTGTVRVTLDKLSPHHPSYLNLKEALSQYKKYAAKGGWRSVPQGPSLKPGEVDQRVTAIRSRLASTGEYHSKGGESNLYDDQLKTAVKAFQARHHVEPDGVIGKSTVSAMNISVTDRINQIRVNLERTRWVVHDMPSSSIIIDIAGFALQYYHDNQPVWNAKVMVGQPYHQTPVFRSAITYIVLNPTWTPTPDIVKNETVPSIVKDPEYLAKQRLRIFDSSGSEVNPQTIRWHQYQGKYLPYTLRQDPGTDNSLGVIKFLFPNPYHVYLHDTPSKSLFGRTQRAFSHGCIRVQNPLELARLILANDPGNPITVEKMDQILASGKTTTVILKQPLPIYLMYWTTNVRDGKVMFKPDLYNRDEGILAALNAPPSRLESAIQMPEGKNGMTTANQHVKVERIVRFVQTVDQQNLADPNAKDSL